MTTPGWTDVHANVHVGAEDYWIVSEGPELTAATTIAITHGMHNIVTSTPVEIQTITGGIQNGPARQFVIFRVGSEGVTFGPGGNISAAPGARAAGRWVKFMLRENVWEEQSLALGDFSTGVLSFGGRVGEVVPLAGDYAASGVSATDPTGGAGATVQAVLANLATEIDGVAASIPSPYVSLFNTRSGSVTPQLGDYAAPILGMTSFTVSDTTIPGPTIQDALQQIVAAIGGVAPGGVLTFAARTGNVAPQLGDYTATIVGATDPTGLGGATTQAALNNLNTRINGLSSGSGILSIATPGQTFAAGSPNYPNMTFGAADFNSGVSTSAAIPSSGGVDTSVPAGTIRDQLIALASRTANNIPYIGGISVAYQLDSMVLTYAKLNVANTFVAGNTFTNSVEFNNYVRLKGGGSGTFLNGTVTIGDGSGGAASVTVNAASSWTFNGPINILKQSSWGVNQLVAGGTSDEFVAPVISGFTPIAHHATAVGPPTSDMVWAFGAGGVRVHNHSGGALTAVGTIVTTYIKDTAFS